jgi:hypothetical protein
MLGTRDQHVGKDTSAPPLFRWELRPFAHVMNSVDEGPCRFADSVLQTRSCMVRYCAALVSIKF